ncbi:MAG: hypothetical protein CHKLHMKO_00263 [Candidatus Argoarchaeum ethanivorans]|uniref:Uncharacterized protein n=1 Tax=Candidatus Argoarchaeum ethanivorans TaxID=2608793 RepID=A0A811T9F5_9EURY|nr:MAG: hypothetical protein CHKLHMKO_00263 [Candidatus Argoarchaeum ethanivorans]
MRFKVAKRLEKLEKVLCSKWDAPELYSGVARMGLSIAQALHNFVV